MSGRKNSGILAPSDANGGGIPDILDFKEAALAAKEPKKQKRQQGIARAKFREKAESEAWKRLLPENRELKWNKKGPKLPSNAAEGRRDLARGRRGSSVAICRRT